MFGVGNVIVFFIKKGEIAAVIPEYTDFCFMTIKEGYFFGEIDLLPSLGDEIRQGTLKAFKECELLVLNKS